MMEKRGKASNLLIFIFSVFFLFILLQLLAPVMQPTGSLSDLSGMTIMVDNEGVWDDISHPWQDIYRVGDVLCHTKASRSFYLNQNQLPFCARCTAIWIGISMGVGLMMFYRISDHRLFFTGFIASIGLLGFDGVGQLLDLWESTNGIRLVTGLCVGFFTGLAIGLIVDELKDFKKEKK
jgi:uncharacterized membrane protein